MDTENAESERREPKPRHMANAPFVCRIVDSFGAMWLFHPRPLMCDREKAREAMELLYREAGIGKPSEAVPLLKGIAAESTVYSWWKDPRIMSWEKFDAVAAKISEERTTEAAKYSVETVLCAIALQELEADETPESKRQEMEFELALIVEGLYDESLSTLLEVARSLQRSQDSIRNERIALARLGIERKRANWSMPQADWDAWNDSLI